MLGVWAVKLYKDKKESEREAELAERERDEYAELGRGLAEYNQKMQDRKNQAKEKILKLFETKTKISNQEAAKVLNVSCASARRYFDDLEAEGRAKQIGKSGKKVYYSKI